LPVNDCGFQKRKASAAGMSEFPFDIVGFDLDGTLLDTHEDLAAAVNHALGLAGRNPVPAAEVRPLIGGGSRKMLHRALSLRGSVPEDRFEELYRALLEYYRDHIAVHTAAYPGTEAMLDGLAAHGAALAVVTNKSHSLAVKLLDEVGLSRHFCAIIGGDTLGEGRGKPKPDQILEMMARAGRRRGAYVGDTSYDTRAAKAAGLPCVAVSFGFADLPLNELGAAAVIDHFDELIPALERL
jgi:phosphoglycolate phosphatase